MPIRKIQASTSEVQAKSDEVLSDLEEDFNTEETLKKLLDESTKNPSQSKAGFKLLGFKFK